MQEPCQYGKDSREMLNKMEECLDGNLTRIWKEINNINKDLLNRAPVWMTLLLALMTAIIGAMGSAMLGKG